MLFFAKNACPILAFYHNLYYFWTFTDVRSRPLVFLAFQKADFAAKSFQDHQKVSDIFIKAIQLTFTCSKSTIGTLEKGGKYVQSWQ